MNLGCEIIFDSSDAVTKKDQNSSQDPEIEIDALTGILTDVCSNLARLEVAKFRNIVSQIFRFVRNIQSLNFLKQKTWIKLKKSRKMKN